MKLNLDQNMFLSIADLPPEEQLEIIKGLAMFPNDCNAKSYTWKGIKDKLIKDIEKRKKFAEFGRIGALKRWKKNDEKNEKIIENFDDKKTLDNIFSNDNESLVSMTENESIRKSLNDKKSSLSLFLETGFDYEFLSADEREFVDRIEVRKLCKWYKENKDIEEKNIYKIKKFKPPTIEEWLSFCHEKGLDESTMRSAYESYVEGNWRDSHNNQIRNWKMKILQVWASKSNNLKRNKNLFERDGMPL